MEFLHSVDWINLGLLIALVISVSGWAKQYQKAGNLELEANEWRCNYRNIEIYRDKYAIAERELRETQHKLQIAENAINATRNTFAYVCDEKGRIK